MTIKQSPVHTTLPLTFSEAGGTIYLTPCPGTKELTLTDSLAQLKTQGVKAILTMMPDSEMKKFEVTDLPTETQQQGMQWFHFPVTDDCAPDETTMNNWHQKISPELTEFLNQGENIAIHCKGGSGRTGLAAGMLLVDSKVEHKDAIEQVKAVNPKSFTKEIQVEFLESYS